MPGDANCPFVRENMADVSSVSFELNSCIKTGFDATRSLCPSSERFDSLRVGDRKDAFGVVDCTFGVCDAGDVEDAGGTGPRLVGGNGP